MKAIRKRCNDLSVFFAIGVFFTALFAVKLMMKAASVFGSASIALLILLIRQSRLLHEANLIWDNRILTVPSTVVSMSGGEEKKEVEETVVSTFGILIGTKIYKWGMDGVLGVRLMAIKIDRVRIYLTFGDRAETMRVELLHGMSDKQEVMEIKQKILSETGVESVVSGW